MRDKLAWFCTAGRGRMLVFALICGDRDFFSELGYWCYSRGATF